MFLTLDGTALVQLINFAIFFAILNVVFLRPVGRAIRERRAFIDGVQSDFERYSQRTRDLRASAGARRLAARREAEAAVVKTRAEAEAQATDLEAAYAAQAAMLGAEARATVEAELAAARTREPELAGALAASLLDRAVGSAR